VLIFRNSSCCKHSPSVNRRSPSFNHRSLTYHR
jgi:hypothetical protein